MSAYFVYFTCQTVEVIKDRTEKKRVNQRKERSVREEGRQRSV